jgi:hypothetical protein
MPSRTEPRGHPGHLTILYEIPKVAMTFYTTFLQLDFVWHTCKNLSIRRSYHFNSSNIIYSPPRVYPPVLF